MFQLNRAQHRFLSRTKQQRDHCKEKATNLTNQGGSITLSCTDAIVLAEWKAYRGVFPKNELLRFKAATDDYYMSLGTAGLSRPVFRIFGGIGIASDDLRRYAALHGIALTTTATPT